MILKGPHLPAFMVPHSGQALTLQLGWVWVFTKLSKKQPPAFGAYQWAALRLEVLYSRPQRHAAPALNLGSTLLSLQRLSENTDSLVLHQGF